MRRARFAARCGDETRVAALRGGHALRRLATTGAAMLVTLGVAFPAGVAGAAPFKWTMRGIPAVLSYTMTSVACSGTSCVGLASECGVGGCGGLLPAKAFPSANLGVSWKDAVVPRSVGDAAAVSCGSPTLCVATATKGPLGPRRSSAIIVTRNGGKSWTVDVEAAYSLGPAAACASATSCFALGTPKTTSSSLTSVGVVTSNGGKSWSKAGFPAKKAYIAAAACASATSCIAVGDTSTYTAGAAFRSQNAGKSWKQIPLPAGALGVLTVSCNGKVCAATTQTQLLVSKNGGKSWTMHLLPVRVGFHVVDAACLSGSRCLLVGYQTESLHSIPAAELSGNGGASWGGQTLPKVDGSLAAIACVPTSCVAVGLRVVYSGGTPKAEYPLAFTY